MVVRFEKGVRNVIDIVDTNGRIYNFEQLKEILYILKGTFLDYKRLINKLPKTWLDVIYVNENNEKCKYSKSNIQKNCYIKLIMKDKKGSRNIYDKILPVKEQFIKDRCNRELGQIRSEEKTLAKKVLNISMKSNHEISSSKLTIKFW